MAKLMTAEECLELVTRVRLVGNMALTVSTEEIGRLHQQISFEHAAGPVIDPTGYRARMGKMDAFSGLLSAFAEFRAAAQASGLGEKT